MIQAICNLCGKKVDKEFVYKVKIEPWFEPKLRGMVYRREIDCCEACAKAIVIENNHLMRSGYSKVCKSFAESVKE